MGSNPTPMIRSAWARIGISPVAPVMVPTKTGAVGWVYAPCLVSRHHGGPKGVRK